MPKQHEDPRISLNKLGEYMFASPAKRKSIVKDQKYPKTFKGAYHSIAQAHTVALLTGEKSEEEVKAEALRLLHSASDTDWKEQRNSSCLEAVESLVDSYEEFGFESYDVNKASHTAEKLDIGGSLVSVRPELLLNKECGGKQSVGAVKLYLSKSSPLTQERAEYVATTVHQYVEENIDSEDCDYRDCYVIDVFKGEIFSAPKSYKKRRKDIEAACEEISHSWSYI